jgi:hypothetical protein
MTNNRIIIPSKFAVLKPAACLWLCGGKGLQAADLKLCIPQCPRNVLVFGLLQLAKLFCHLEDALTLLRGLVQKFLGVLHVFAHCYLCQLSPRCAGRSFVSLTAFWTRKALWLLLKIIIRFRKLLRKRGCAGGSVERGFMAEAFTNLGREQVPPYALQSGSAQDASVLFLATIAVPFERGPSARIVQTNATSLRIARV